MKRSPGASQRGQAMVECALGCTILALLPVVVLLMADWHEIQTRTLGAARFAAFESMWAAGRVPAEETLRRTRDLFFAESHVTTPGGTDLVTPDDDVGVRASETAPPGRASAVMLFMLRPLGAVSGFLGERFDLTDRGFHNAEISVRVRDADELPAPLDTLGLEVHERLAVLGDSWNASGPDHVRRRVTGLVPTSALEEPQRLLQPLLDVVAAIEPSVRELCFGRIDPDLLPPDRLGPARGRVRASRSCESPT
jgi:hypothetical protein